MLERVETGFGFLEGPIWHPAEAWLVFSDIARSAQWRWSAGDGLTPFRRPSNQANGNCFDLQGRVVSCEHAASQVVRHEHEGKLVRPIATHYGGKALNSPNDVICDTLGRIWFSDPSFGRIRPDLGLIREEEQDCRGVYRLDPDGTLTRVADDLEQPNGLCLSQDERRLFVNDTPRGHVRVWDVAADGRLSGGALWCAVEGEGEGVVDGMKVTRGGQLLVNGPGGVHVFSGVDGGKVQCLGVIRTPEKSTNFCFGGPDLRSLFITASTSLYRIETRMDGLPMIHRGKTP
ncbi:MAG: SMP-30/gluconolactonase/LRE family protein [Pseudomonadota bacterium]